MKQIIVDVSPAGEIQITTKGFQGKTCVSESKFLKDLLGAEISQELQPVFFVNNGQEEKQFIPICG